MQPPVMPEDGHTTRVTTGIDLTPSEKESAVVQHIWDDEDTKAFYESLPDLRAFVPAVLLGEGEPKLAEQHGKDNKQSNDTAMDITQILLAAQSPDANLRTVAEGNLKQFQEQNAQQQNPGNAQVMPNQNSPGPASVDSTTQTGHPGAGDLQEINVYEKMFINDLREIFKRIGVNTKHKSRDAGKNGT